LSIDDEKHESRHGQRRTAAEGNFRQREIRGQGGPSKVFSIKPFSSCKDLLPEKRELSRVLPEFTCKILRNDCTKPSKISAKLVN
jgi:hypothetical protein